MIVNNLKKEVIVVVKLFKYPKG